MALFQTNLQPIGGKNLSIQDLRDLAKNEPQEFIRKIQAGVEQQKLKITDIRNWDYLYMALADVSVQAQMATQKGGIRAITASAFPILTGTLAIAAINEAYDAVEKVGDMLVTEMEDNKKVTTMVNLHTLDKNADEVKDGQDFPEIGTDEEKIEIRHRMNGRKLVIGASAIEENEAADIVSRINALGEIAADWVEEQTLYRVTDHYGSGASPTEPYVYRPNGTGTQLYNATANSPGTRAPSGTRVTSNALADESDLEAARVRLGTMKNARGKRINVPYSERILLVPDALVGKALKIANSEYVPGVENELSNWGPAGKWRVTPERIISTTKLDDLSSSAWYYGAFKRQFVRKWKLRFEYVTLGQDTQAYLNSRIAFQARIAWDCEIGARDYVYCVQNLSASTSPVDE